MKRRLPKGEETLPITRVAGRMVTLEELRTRHPAEYSALIKTTILTVDDELLIERFRRRMIQNRVLTIYRYQCKGEITCPVALTPEEQLRHMEERTETGLELLKAEMELLKEELKIIRGE